jgi:hypothetical protein
MLTVDPAKRHTAQQLIKDEWLTNDGKDPVHIYEVCESAGTISSLESDNFNENVVTPTAARLSP